MRNPVQTCFPEIMCKTPKILVRPNNFAHWEFYDMCTPILFNAQLSNFTFLNTTYGNFLILILTCIQISSVIQLMSCFCRSS